MTFFLLLVSVASVLTLSQAILHGSRFGILGIVIGVLIGGILAVAQFVGYHKLADRLLDDNLLEKFSSPWDVMIASCAYVAVVVFGSLCVTVIIFLVPWLARLCGLQTG